MTLMYHSHSHHLQLSDELLMVLDTGLVFCCSKPLQSDPCYCTCDKLHPYISKWLYESPYNSSISAALFSAYINQVMIWFWLIECSSETCECWCYSCCSSYLHIISWARISSKAFLRIDSGLASNCDKHNQCNFVYQSSRNISSSVWPNWQCWQGIIS